MRFILASNNEKKLREMREILSDLGIDVISQREAGYNIEAEETGETFAENAFIKAEAACKASGLPAIADDSGLVVEALNGAPGVYSARYGGAGLDDGGRVRLLLKNMEDVEHRNAKFVSSIACVFPDGTILRAEGECCGEIALRPVGENGFGYDPVFFLPEKGVTMAQLDAAEKNSISHRGKALKNFRTELEKHLGR